MPRLPGRDAAALAEEKVWKVVLSCCQYPHCQGVRWFNDKGILEEVRALPETGPPCPEVRHTDREMARPARGTPSGPARVGAGTARVVTPHRSGLPRRARMRPAVRKAVSPLGLLLLPV